MIAIIYKNEAPILHILLEIVPFLLVKLNQLMSAEVSKWIQKQLITSQIHNFLFLIYRNRCILHQ